MVGEERVAMSVKESRRVHVMRHVVLKRLTQKEAGRVLGLMERQIQGDG
jgi:hypothetical protein